MTISTLVMMQMLQISGIFLLGEIFFANILIGMLFVVIVSVYGQALTLYPSFNFLATMCCNLFEFYLDQEREISSFNSLMFVDKQSTNLSQFINRLLPLHVGTNPHRDSGCHQQWDQDRRTLPERHSPVCGHRWVH